MWLSRPIANTDKDSANCEAEGHEGQNRKSRLILLSCLENFYDLRENLGSSGYSAWKRNVQQSCFTRAPRNQETWSNKQNPCHISEYEIQKYLVIAHFYTFLLVLQQVYWIESLEQYLVATQIKIEQKNCWTAEYIPSDWSNLYSEFSCWIFAILYW